MTTLADLFPDDSRPQPRSEANVADTTAKLSHLVGGQRVNVRERRSSSSSDAEAISRRVEAAVADAAPAVSPVSGIVTRRRGRRRTDWLSMTAATVAVLALAGTAAFTAVQSANATPASTAYKALVEDEADLASAEKGLSAMRDRIADSIENAVAAAPEDRAALSALDAAVIDTAARDAAVVAVDVYVSALQGIDLPDPLPSYTRGEVESGDLASVGAAIDAVQAQTIAVDMVTAELRTIRTDVQAATDEYQKQLGLFSASFIARAAQENNDGAMADQRFRDAVTSAAAAVAATRIDSEQGRQAIAGYRAAVLALRADQVRAVEDAQLESDYDYDYDYGDGDGGTGDDGMGDGGQPEVPTPDPGIDPTGPPIVDPVDPPEAGDTVPVG